MTFDELWELVCESTKLPSEAKRFFPQGLSEKTKKIMIESGRSPVEIGRIIENSIDEINHGSVERIDTLINKYLN